MIRVAVESELKGAAPRVLRRKVREVEAAIGSAAAELLRGLESAANKIIARAPRGAEIAVQISVEDDPLGGWNGHVVVDVTPRPPRR